MKWLIRDWWCRPLAPGVPGWCPERPNSRRISARRIPGFGNPPSSASRVQEQLLVRHQPVQVEAERRGVLGQVRKRAGASLTRVGRSAQQQRPPPAHRRSRSPVLVRRVDCCRQRVRPVRQRHLRHALGQRRAQPGIPGVDGKRLRRHHARVSARSLEANQHSHRRLLKVPLRGLGGSTRLCIRMTCGPPIRTRFSWRIPRGTVDGIRMLSVCRVLLTLVICCAISSPSSAQCGLPAPTCSLLKGALIRGWADANAT